MPDDLNRRAPEDPTRINIHQEYEITYWTRELGCTRYELINAVAAVGPYVAKVRVYLNVIKSRRR